MPICGVPQGSIVGPIHFTVNHSAAIYEPKTVFTAMIVYYSFNQNASGLLQPSAIFLEINADKSRNTFCSKRTLALQPSY